MSWGRRKLVWGDNSVFAAHQDRSGLTPRHCEIRWHGTWAITENGLRARHGFVFPFISIPRPEPVARVVV